MIKIINLNKTANKKKILKNISIEFPSKGFVCITGKSGSGKSTLLNTICNITKYEGDIFIDNINTRSIKNLRNDYIGMVFQDYNLIDDISCYENVKIGINSSLKDEENIMDILEAVGLEKYRNVNPKYLSGGEKQRLAIARAIIKKPKILILDEPTGALDSENSDFIFSLLKEISKDCLVLMVSHDIDKLNVYADRILTLNNGKIENDKIINQAEAKINDVVSFTYKKNKFNYIKHRTFKLKISLILCSLITILLYVLKVNVFDEKYEYNYAYDEKECYVIDSNDKILSLNTNIAIDISRQLEKKGISFNERSVLSSYYSLEYKDNFEYNLSMSKTSFYRNYYKEGLDYKLIYGREIKESNEIIIDKEMADTLIKDFENYGIYLTSYQQLCEDLNMIERDRFGYYDSKYEIVGISNCKFSGIYIKENTGESVLKYYKPDNYSDLLIDKAEPNKDRINYYTNVRAINDYRYKQIGLTNGINPEVVFKTEEDFNLWYDTVFGYKYHPYLSCCPITNQIEIVSGRKPIYKTEIILPETFPKDELSKIEDYTVVGYYKCDYYYDETVVVYTSQTDYYYYQYGDFTCYSDEEIRIDENYRIISINNYKKLQAQKFSVMDILVYLPTVISIIISLTLIVIYNSKDKYNYAVLRSFGASKLKLIYYEFKEYNLLTIYFVLIPYIIIVLIGLIFNLFIGKQFLLFIISYGCIFIMVNLYLVMHNLLSTGDILNIFKKKNSL